MSRANGGVVEVTLRYGNDSTPRRDCCIGRGLGVDCSNCGRFMLLGLGQRRRAVPFGNFCLVELLLRDISTGC